MCYKKRLCGLILLALLAFFRPAAAEDAARPCTPAARVFETTICREDVTTEQAHIEAIRQQYEEQGLDSEKALKTRSLERLREIVWNTALEHKFGAGTLEPTVEEIDLFNNTFRQSLDGSYAKNKATARKIENLIASGNYPKDKESELRSVLATIEKSLAFYEEKQSYKEKMPPEYHDMIVEAERGLAKTMMQEWKINKALYEEYGGRLVERDGAIEPVDAMSKFLAYIRGAGKLKIIDPEFTDLFKDMEIFIAGPHEPLPPAGDGKYSEYFSSPVKAARQ